MNQQRSRRFRASKETQEKIDEIARIRSELESKGAYLPPERPKEAHFDSNCITPGTPFMDRLSKCLHYYIHDRSDCCIIKKSWNQALEISKGPSSEMTPSKIFRLRLDLSNGNVKSFTSSFMNFSYGPNLCCLSDLHVIRLFSFLCCKLCSNDSLYY